MYSPAGLQAWEIVAASGLCAVGFLCVSTVIGLIVAQIATREPAVARDPATIRPSAPAQPVFGAVTGNPVAA